MSHPASDAFELYTIGALEGEAREAFEEHVESCERCAAILSREARLEVQLREAAEALERRGRRRFPGGSSPRNRWVAGAGIAVAASLALVVLVRSQARLATSPTLSLAKAQAVQAVPVDTREQLLARNNGVALDGLDEPMDGSQSQSQSESPMGRAMP